MIEEHVGRIVCSLEGWRPTVSPGSHLCSLAIKSDHAGQLPLTHSASSVHAKNYAYLRSIRLSQDDRSAGG
jgi:hypothetical protein